MPVWRTRGTGAYPEALSEIRGYKAEIRGLRGRRQSGQVLQGGAREEGQGAGGGAEGGEEEEARSRRRGGGVGRGDSV